MFLLSALAASLGGCASTPVAPNSAAAPRDETVYLIARGWHTEIGVATDAARGLPSSFTLDFPGARYLVFGWGQRDYYMARNPGLGDLLRAARPGPSVVLIVPLQTSPAQQFGAANVIALHVSRLGLSRLSAYVSASIAKHRDGSPRRIASGPELGSLFYASTGTYSLAYTCNTWTAEALHVTGLPIHADGVIFAGEVLSQARRLAVGGEAS